MVYSVLSCDHVNSLLLFFVFFFGVFVFFSLHSLPAVLYTLHQAITSKSCSVQPIVNAVALCTNQTANQKAELKHGGWHSFFDWLRRGARLRKEFFLWDFLFGGFGLHLEFEHSMSRPC